MHWVCLLITQTARVTVNAHEQIVIQPCLFTMRQLLLTYNNELIISKQHETLLNTQYYDSVANMKFVVTFQPPCLYKLAVRKLFHTSLRNRTHDEELLQVTLRYRSHVEINFFQF